MPLKNISSLEGSGVYKSVEPGYLRLNSDSATYWMCLSFLSYKMGIILIAYTSQGYYED